ncbi:MAG: SRPBCC family protein [Myxococcota bacterium]
MTRQTVLIEAAPVRVFTVITDYPRYPEFLPEMRRVEVQRRESGMVQVRFELELVMRVSYVLELIESPPHTLRWSLIEGRMMEKNDGAWELEETASGATQATYSLDVKLRGLIPKSVSTRLVGETLPSTLARFKQRAEGG